MDTMKILRKDIEEDNKLRSRMAEALGESEERLRTLIHAMPDIVVFKDGQGHWLVANQALLDLLRLSSEDCIGRTDTDLAKRNLFFSDTLLSWAASDEQTWSRGAPSHAEEVIPTLDGSDRIYDTMKIPLYHADGRRKGLVILGRDITRRKAMERELFRARKLESLSILAGGLAHDFNNILTAILGNISLARIFAESDERLQDWLSKAEAASLKAKDLVGQLLTFSRSGSPIRRKIGIIDLIRETVGFTLRGSNVRCTFELPDHLWSVLVDGDQIHQVIQSLVINADQAMPEGGLIHVAAANVQIAQQEHEHLKVGRYVRLVIQDQGVGIDRRHIDKIFDPYFSTKQKGCGMGLAICYSIVRNHQGHISVESELGSGTTVTVYLPAAPHEAGSDSGSDAVKQRPTRVLLMDDDRMVREVAQDMLSSLGYAVILASDGAEAVQQYRAALGSGELFHAVILDLTVPGGLGARQTVKLLRELDPEVRTIVASGYSTDPVLTSFKDHGFIGAITKPFNLAELQEILRNIPSRR